MYSYDDDDEKGDGKFRRELGEEVYAFIRGIPLFGDMQYEYKDRLDKNDDPHEWERRSDDNDDVWYDIYDGYWSDEDFGDPSKPMRSYSDALKHRSPASDLYDDDLGINEVSEGADFWKTMVGIGCIIGLLLLIIYCITNLE